jgi:hypothetical protein
VSVGLDELIEQVDTVARSAPGAPARSKWGAWLDVGGQRISGYGPTPRAAIQDALSQVFRQPEEEEELW